MVRQRTDRGLRAMSEIPIVCTANICGALAAESVLRTVYVRAGTTAHSVANCAETASADLIPAMPSGQRAAVVLPHIRIAVRVFAIRKQVCDLGWASGVFRPSASQVRGEGS